MIFHRLIVSWVGIFLFSLLFWGCESASLFQFDKCRSDSDCSGDDLCVEGTCVPAEDDDDDNNDNDSITDDDDDNDDTTDDDDDDNDTTDDDDDNDTVDDDDDNDDTSDDDDDTTECPCVDDLVGSYCQNPIFSCLEVSEMTVEHTSGCEFVLTMNMVDSSIFTHTFNGCEEFMANVPEEPLPSQNACNVKFDPETVSFTVVCSWCGERDFNQEFCDPYVDGDVDGDVKECETRGGVCNDLPSCPQNMVLSASDLDCADDAATPYCCVPATTPQCVLNGGLCQSFGPCPQGYSSISAQQECAEMCCMPIPEPTCAENGGFCAIPVNDSCPLDYHLQAGACQESYLCCKADEAIPCEVNGGYCQQFTGGIAICNEGYERVEGANQLGCDVANYENCCLPSQFQCGSDSDCGSPSCITLWATGRCRQILPDCDEQTGECGTLEEMNDNSECNQNTGLCVDTVECVNHSDCGVLRCYDIDQGCREVSPLCEAGTCGTTEGFFQNSVCTPSGHCVASQCSEDLDCLDQEWNVDCYGHWDCIDSMCVPQCGGSCGNDFCQQDEGESNSTCANDCPANECSSDSDCTACDNDNNGTCTQFSGRCLYSSCSWEHVSSVNGQCNFQTGLCEENQQNCTEDFQCGSQSCYETFSECVEVSPFCSDDGTCESTEQRFSPAYCDMNTGTCQTENVCECDDFPGNYCLASETGPLCFMVNVDNVWVEANPQVECGYVVNATFTDGTPPESQNIIGCVFNNLTVQNYCTVSGNSDGITADCQGVCTLIFRQDACGE